MLEAAGVQTASNKVYPAETTDFTPLALAVVQSHADVVVLGTQLPDAIAFIQTFEQQHYSPKSLVETSGPDQGAQFSDKVGAANTEGLVGPAGLGPSGKTTGTDPI